MCIGCVITINLNLSQNQVVPSLLTVVDASGNEFVPDQSAQERRRRPGEPAFFKPLPNDNFLPSLITVLHSIPQGREALLSADDLLDDYGQNRRWWEGDSVETTRISILDENGVDSNRFDVLHETQRLMAFLDKTERSYGSVGDLTKLQAFRDAAFRRAGADQSFNHFLAAWQTASLEAQTEYEYDRLFGMHVGRVGDVEPDAIHCVSIPATDLPTEPSATLYDALDNHFWQGQFPDAFIFKIAPIVVMHVSQPNSSLRPLPGQVTQTVRLQIPAILYADRYMHEHQKRIRAVYRKMQELQGLVDLRQKKIETITKFQYVESEKTGNAQALLEWSISHLERRSTEMRPDDMSQENRPIPEDGSLSIGTGAPSALHVLERLRAVNTHLRIVVEGAYLRSQQTSSSIKLLIVS